MKRYQHRPTKYYALIKDKWLNKTKTVMVTTREGLREAHKFVYYNYTTNKEDIVRIKDRHGNILFTLQKGFMR